MGSEAEAARAQLADFHRLHPEISVDLQQVPWSAAHEKLLTAYVGGHLPDVFHLGNTWIAEFALLAAIAPVDERLRSAPSRPIADVFPGILDTNVIDGTLFGVPWYVDTRLLFVRTNDRWPSPPRTWKEWRQRAGEHGHSRMPILLPLAEWQPLVILAMQRGAHLLADNDTRGAFREPAFRDALAFYTEIFASSLAPMGGESQLANVYQEFGAANVASFLSGPWNLRELAKRLPPEEQDNWTTMPLPNFDDTYPGVSVAGGASLVVSATSRRPDDAWRLVEFLTRTESQIDLYRRTGDLPARQSAWQITGIASDERTASFWAQLQNVRATPKIPEWEQIAAKIAEHAELAVRGRQTVDEACAALDRDVDAILAKRRSVLASDRRDGAQP